ncbi:Gfo/Idh/MocA family protein [Brachybacterium saurashtrense]|uniref:Gfo/Idh/MocA family oxidoreductase n=1 Tax=Brachybacterium saurashtrense TaxID=556288 RepID=A0A345YP86_9MICO|nr:Gfo/Idh/MocA family oxidoreductase [Brachybacterium saurashtrense]AXK45738.1 gfo/Idh/MocA family oxidoreductase [Brachybacterium saurashtrense]RRR24756.1 gfo/Idh/MocA family oxidoreductase [Brachybacterium saurashtrense]
MEMVRIGIVGAGFAAQFHLRALRRLARSGAEVVGVAASSPQSARAFAARHHVPQAHPDVASLLASDVDLVVVAVPTALHEEVTVAAAAAGKHVLVEKPLTGAFGSGAASAEIAPTERAERELAAARAAMERITGAVERAGVQLFYAENWVHAPAVARVRSLLSTSGAPLLDLRAEQSHSGSHASAARRRASAGGGALLTLGAHPLATVLHLKAVESGLSGRGPIRPVSVTAETASLHQLVASHGGDTALVRDWEDVETWANLVLAFDDGSRATVTASFQMLGGVRDQLEVYTADAAYRTKMTQHDELSVFTPDPAAFADQVLQEKVESATGWQAVPSDAGWSHGHLQQFEDVLGALREGREPLSGLPLARDTVEIVYSAYLSAARGERVAVGGALPGAAVDAPHRTSPALAHSQEAGPR